jgi:trehalose/maltose transport system substrate-binding protein
MKLFSFIIIKKMIFLIAFISAVCAFAKPVTVKIAIGTNTPDLEFTKQQLKIFEKSNSDIKVEVLRLSISASENYGYILQVLEAKSSDIDIFAIASAWNGDLAPNLIDINKYLPKETTKKFLSKTLETCVVDGKVVSYPWNVDCGILYYRNDLLKKYNLKVPTTWIELTKAANIIKQGEIESGNKDFVGYVWQGNAYEGLTCNALEWIASNDGGTVVSDSKEITINNPNAIKAVDLAARWVGTISPRGVLSMQEEDCRTAFQAGNAAFMRNWPYCYTLMEQADSKIKGKFEVATLPAGTGGDFRSTISGWGLGINKYSQNPDIAAKVIQFLTSTDFETGRAVKLGAIPTVNDVYNQEEFRKAIPYFKVIQKSIDHGVACPAIQTAPYYNQVSSQFYKAVYSVLTGSKGAATAFAELSKEIKATTGLKIKN